MHPTVSQLITALWIAVGVVWLIGALGTKRTARGEGFGSRLTELLIVIPAAFLLFNGRLSIGFLGWRFVPDTGAAVWTGVGLTALGLVFTVAARLYLGRNWSGRVTIKEDHTLICRGPYRIVRHPIYSGLLTAALGTALADGEVRGLLACLLAFVGWWLKTRVEERFLSEQFGADYDLYRRQVRAALIPFLL